MSALETLMDIPVSVFRGQVACAESARLSLTSEAVVVSNESGERRYVRADVTARPLVGDAPARLLLPDGGEVVCTDSASVLAAFPQSETWITRLERKWWIALVALIAVAGIAFAMYKYLIPIASEFAVARISPAMEAEFGVRMLSVVDRSLLHPSDLSDTERQAIQKRFDELLSASGLPIGAARLHFRKARDWIGPNAFAIPGGDIVITDQLVQVLQSADMAGAVLGHEIGHVKFRHSVKKLVADSMVAVLMGTLVGDVSGVGGLVATAPTILVNQHYSREAERESDQYAFQLLKKIGSSPVHFADAMRCLATVEPRSKPEVEEREKGKRAIQYERCDPKAARKMMENGWDFSSKGESSAISLVSSHPVTLERIQAAEAAALDTVPPK